MPTQDCTPSPDNARSLLSRLLDREVMVVLSKEAVEYSSAGPAMLALYEDDQKICRRAVVCDMTLAASLGAGLAMIPVRIAEEGARKSTLPENLAENYAEICNVMSRLFRVPTRGMTFFLRRVVGQEGVELDLDEEAVLAVPDLQIDFLISVQGYGQGRITLLGN